MRSSLSPGELRNYGGSDRLYELTVKLKETEKISFCLRLAWALVLWGMARARWIVPWADSETKPAIYHCMARVVDRRFAFEPEDKEQFRIYMRMMENFSGCRVLAYCIMCNHFHILLEVVPRPKTPLSDAELLKRLGALYSKAFVASVATELADAREVLAQGLAPDGEAYVRRIHERFTYRMHDLSEFMKTLLQRFTRWHNTRTGRRGNLWAFAST
jgi:REP element-mobilizing transposase RayT